jgi:hypothetical protein
VNFRILASGIPIAVFFVLTRIAAPWLAITGGFAASTIVFSLNRRDRLIGQLTLFAFGCVGVSALVGLIWGSEKAYLASGPLSDFLFVPWYLGSVYAGRPLVGGIAQELVPAIALKVPREAPVFAWLSVAWAGFDILHGSMRVFLLSHLSVGQYIVWSRVVGWPSTGSLLALSGFLIWRASRHLVRREVMVPAIEMREGAIPEAAS